MRRIIMVASEVTIHNSHERFMSGRLDHHRPVHRISDNRLKLKGKEAIEPVWTRSSLKEEIRAGIVEAELRLAAYERKTSSVARNRAYRAFEEAVKSVERLLRKLKGLR